MKRFALVLCLVFAISSIASAIDFSSTTLTLRGYNVWTKGVAGTPENVDTRVMKLASKGTGWTASAEFTMKAFNSAGADKGNQYLTLSKYAFETTETPFKLNVWANSHSLSNYQTPFVWVQDAAAANATNWKARLTAQIFDGEAVFTIDNAAATYYAFYKKVFGNTTLGVAYKTNFKHTTSSSVYAISKLPGVTVTGEVAADHTTSVNLSPKYGLQGVFDFGLTLKGSYVTSGKVLTLEATQLMNDKLSRYYGKYLDNGGTKQVIGEVTFRAKNDQDITRTFTANTTWYNIANTGSNYWLVTTGWAAGAKVTRNFNSNIIVNLNGFYEFVPGKVKALATINYTNNDNAATADTWDVQLRGYYKANDKFTIHPRVTIDKTWVKAGSTVDYVINKGRVVGAAWYEYNQADNTKSQEKFELGWSIGL